MEARVRFCTRPQLLLDHLPPTRPPWRRGYGTYCIRAACELIGEDGCALGKVVGYDRYMHIQDSVRDACRISCRDHPGSVCSPVQLTILRDARKQCSGEVYFVIDSSTPRRIF